MNDTVREILQKQVESLKREAGRLGEQHAYLLKEADQVAGSIATINAMVGDIESEIGPTPARVPGPPDGPCIPPQPQG